MNRKLYFLFFLVLLFSINYISAIETAVNTSFDLTTSCDGFTCSSMTITIKYPNSTTFIDNQAMTDKGYYANYTLIPAVNGEYNFYYSDGTNSSSGSFLVTPSGESVSIPSALFYVVLLIILLTFFILILFYGLNTDNIVGQTFSIGFGYLLLIGIFFIAWQMAFNFILSSPFLIEFFRIGFIVLAIGFIPLLFILFAYGSYMMLQIKEIKDMQERGISIDEINERKFGAAGRY